MTRQDKRTVGIFLTILLILAIFAAISGCATTSKTYTVTFESGAQHVYKDRYRAVLFHDQQNTRQPNSASIDSVKTK